MKPVRGTLNLKTLSRVAAGALTGRFGVAAMVFGYSLCALVLLAYVSTQIYSYSLMEDIASRERVQRDLKEKIGLQTREYAALASRERISRICETRLGMVQARADQIIRVSIDASLSTDAERDRRSDESVDLPDVVGTDFDVITGVLNR